MPCPTCGKPVTVPGNHSRSGSSSTGSANYFTRHWRGELSLGVSFWVNGILGTLLLRAVAKQLEGEIDSINLQFYALLSLLFVIIALSATAWQNVGIWQSASNHAGSIWALLAKVTVLIGLAPFIYLICLSYIPQFEEALSIINGDNGLPPYRVWALPGGTEVKFEGGIRAGCSDQLEAVLATVPQARALDIESPGGRIIEARKMMKLVHDHNLSTYTSQECMSAATLVLLSGRERIVGVHARVGFHSGYLPGATTGEENQMNNLVRTTMESLGVSSDFVARVLATPSKHMWFPTYREMYAAGVVTRQSFEDPFAPHFPPNGSPLWQVRNKASTARVIAGYPNVAVAGTPFNIAFVSEYKHQKATDPAFLDNPEYPEVIVSILQTTHPDLASPPPAPAPGP